MGTRHHQKVISKSGELKVSQYGQWDGYPSGQGIEILTFLRDNNITKYSEEIDKIRLITDSEIKEVEQDKNWPDNYPHLSRDCGSRIHGLILNGEVPSVDFIDDAEANQWCAAFYVIDLQKMVFTSFYGDESITYKLDGLPTEDEYLKSMGVEVETK